MPRESYGVELKSRFRTWTKPARVACNLPSVYGIPRPYLAPKWTCGDSRRYPPSPALPETMRERSIGIGKTIVDALSPAICVKVCR